jgi:hypothetical protein
MNITQLFPPDREEFLQGAVTESSFARCEAATIEELIKEVDTDAAKNILKCYAQIVAQHYQAKIATLEKAARTWKQSDIDAALRVLHSNLTPA